MTTNALRRCALALAATLFAAGGVLMARSRPAMVRLVTSSGGTIRVELARTAQERARGLMFRQSMADDEGMLIVFPAAGRHGIWMKNCRFPLDLVWLDEQMRIVDVAGGVMPCNGATCPIYWPSQAASSVLEVKAGAGSGQRLSSGAFLRLASP